MTELTSNFNRVGQINCLDDTNHTLASKLSKKVAMSTLHIVIFLGKQKRKHFDARFAETGKFTECKHQKVIHFIDTSIIRLLNIRYY